MEQNRAEVLHFRGRHPVGQFMELDAETSTSTFLGRTADSAPQRQLSENVVWTFLRKKILLRLWRFHVYVFWVLLIILTILPLFSSSLKPFWRIICWVAPTLLAIEVDAGNRTFIYIVKAVLWILQVCLAQYMLKVTDGFRKESGLLNAGLPLSILLFLLSCIATVVGRRMKKTVWFRSDVVNVGNDLRSTDDTIYAQLEPPLVRTPLNLREPRGAWVPSNDIESGRKQLTSTEVSRHIIRTSLVTQFVVARVFKDTHNRVLVYCPVAQYRAILLFAALGIAGIVHVLQDLFEGGKEREIVSSMILWLTLPSITLPSLVRIKFGNHASLLYLLGGLLPTQTDVQMWERIGVSAQDLYAALTNAVGAEAIVKDRIRLVAGHGVGTVKVNDAKQARGLCVRSLLRVGESYVRISDGMRFKWTGPLELRTLSELRDTDTVEGRTLNQVGISDTSESQTGLSSESMLTRRFSLAPGTTILQGV